MPPNAAPSRILLRNLNFAQKLLVLTIVLAVSVGYVGALANLFASDASADGKQTIMLDDFAAVYRERGLGGLWKEIESSLGKEDVVRKYHGSASEGNRMEAALRGVMRPILIEELGDEKVADDVARIAIEWSKLAATQRKLSFEEGMPVDGDGNPDFARYRAYFVNGSTPQIPQGVELAPVIKDFFKDTCASCHSPAGTASHAPMQSFEEIDVFSKLDHGISYKQLALTTHVHLLGFSVLFAMTGFLFSLTSYSSLVRMIFVPWALFFQIVEICCWWLAKVDVRFAEAIFYLGPVVGLGLFVQISGIFLDLLFRRRQV